MSNGDRRSHWDSVYTAKNEDEVSWFEPSPDLSLELLAEAGLKTDMAVVDVGGGASRPVDALVRLQVAEIAVPDLSEAALRTAQARLTSPGNVSWIASDVTTWVPDRDYDLWHDLEAFHFLTADSDQQAYVATLRRALRPVAGRSLVLLLRMARRNAVVCRSPGTIRKVCRSCWVTTSACCFRGATSIQRLGVPASGSNSVLSNCDKQAASASACHSQKWTDRFPSHPGHKR